MMMVVVAWVVALQSTGLGGGWDDDTSQPLQSTPLVVIIIISLSLSLSLSLSR
jgi:hypothetical protein